MGRIFEKQEGTMFAPYAWMAKASKPITRKIEVVVKGGRPYPNGNPQLHLVMQNARSVNMPKDRAKTAIKRATSKDSYGNQEVPYPTALRALPETQATEVNELIEKLEEDDDVQSVFPMLP